MSEKLKVLVRAYAYGDCSQEQLMELQQILKSDPVARECFLSEMNMLAVLEDIGENTLLAEMENPFITKDTDDSSEPFLSTWAMHSAIAVAVVLVVITIFWQRHKNNEIATDQISIQSKDEKKREQDRAEDLDVRLGDIDKIQGVPYPDWVVKKDIMTLEELRRFEEMLVGEGFKREQIPRLIEAIARLAFQQKNNDADRISAKLIRKILSDFDLNEEKVELLVGLSKRMSQSGGIIQRRPED